MNKNIKLNKKKDIYVSYYSRISIYIALFLLSLVFGILFAINSFKYNQEEIVKYNEKSNLDYKVYLKKNNFYDREYLDKDMLYVASLIDKININFNYLFSIDSQNNIDIDLNYSIIGKLIISDESKNKNYYEKDYNLLETQTQKLHNNNAKINKKIEIDYDYYNSVANDFRTSYGVNADSKLLVYMVINQKNSGEEKNFTLTEDSNLIISIPLSQRSINISLDYIDLNEQSYIKKKQSYIIDDAIFLIIGIIFIILSTMFAVKLVKLLLKLKTKKTKYDKYVANILKEYDRLIVETPNIPSFNEKNIIKINKFSELLDVRDNLKLPITYSIISKHNKSYFYIIHNNNIYLHTVKAVDLVEQK